MRLYYDTVSASLQSILRKLMSSEVFKDFRLVGGTALAMKLGVIGNQIYRQKDYWDIHDLLEDYSLSEMIQWALQRDPYSFTKDDIIKGLQHVNQVEESPMGIVSLKPLSYWELKVLDLMEEVKAITEIDN